MGPNERKDYYQHNNIIFLVTSNNDSIIIMTVLWAIFLFILLSKYLLDLLEINKLRGLEDSYKGLEIAVHGHVHPPCRCMQLLLLQFMPNATEESAAPCRQGSKWQS